MRAALGLALLLALPVAAQPALEFARLGRDDGLDGNSITALAADAEGAVWLGADGTVDRYDGARVTTSRLGGRAYVYALARDAAGTLWAGSADGLFRRPAGAAAFRRVGLEAAVSALAADGDVLWVGTAGEGLIRLRGERARQITAASGALASDSVEALAVLAGGGVAAATTGGVSWVGAGRARHDRTVRDATALVEAGGRLWAGRATGEVVGLGDGPPVRAGNAGAKVEALEASRARPGTVWVGTRGAGALRLDVAAGALRRLPSAVGLPEGFERSPVFSVLEAEGVLWLGLGQGVAFADLAPPRFRGLEAGPGTPLGVRAVMGVHLSRRERGVVWAATDGTGVFRIEAATGRARRVAGLPVRVAFGLHEDARGDLWVGDDRSTLWRVPAGGGASRPFRLGEGAEGVVAHVAPSAAYPGHLWLSTQTLGLVRFDPRAGRVVERLREAPASRRVPFADVWQALEADGALWVATDGDGLWRVDLEAGRAARVEPEGCALGDAVVSLALGPDGALWVGGRDAQLARLEAGRCRAWGPADGLPPDGVGGVYPDARGHVWVASNLGLARFDPEAGAFTRFTAADGLATTNLYWYADDQASDGRIAVGGDGGLTVFDPLAVPVDDRPRPVALVSVRVDGVERGLEAGGGLELGYRENDVAFAYAALDLRRPDATRYRVRLVGASERWEAAGSETRYPALAPGRYTFEVAATNRDGYWSEPLAVPVTVRPPMWQTAPFWLLVALALGGVGYGAHRVRLEQLRRVERTRRRIADDLHDGIGSKISSVALRLDMAGRRPGVPDDTRAALTTLAGTARSVVGDLRDTVWLVDAGHDDLASVVRRMEQFAASTLEGRGSVEAPAAVPALPLGMEARRDLYLLFTEAVHNAVRHARADRVDVRIWAAGARVGFEVVDDGVGFDPSTLEASRPGAGRGLTTMRQRAAALGGRVVWAPREGGGTAVRFEADLG